MAFLPEHSRTPGLGHGSRHSEHGHQGWRQICPAYGRSSSSPGECKVLCLKQATASGMMWRLRASVVANELFIVGDKSTRGWSSSRYVGHLLSPRAPRSRRACTRSRGAILCTTSPLSLLPTRSPRWSLTATHSRYWDGMATSVERKRRWQALSTADSRAIVALLLRV